MIYAFNMAEESYQQNEILRNDKDIEAYFTGRYFGRHFLFERISPQKTWEGSMGGTVCVAGVVSYFIVFY